jgi:hypothetical protein
MKHSIVTFLSDFGTRDPYVAEMKAVVLSKCPNAKIIDISHEIKKFNIRMGAYTLAAAAPYFPEGTVHVAIVDPGVGTKRRPIILETNHFHFVGPDNGILVLAASRDQIHHIYCIENPQYMLPCVSATFHGRDIFSPVAAYLAQGRDASEFGREVSSYTTPAFEKPRLENGEIFAEVLHIDCFGNIITNITSEMLKKLTVTQGTLLRIKMCGKTLKLRLYAAYGDVSIGETLAIVSSHDFLEFSKNQGNAAEEYKVREGDSVCVQV